MREEEEEKVEPPPSLHFPNSPFSASFSTSSAAAVAWASLLRAASISEREAEAAFCVFCLLSFCRGSNESATGKGFADELKKKKKHAPSPWPRRAHASPRGRRGTSPVPRGAGRGEQGSGEPPQRRSKGTTMARRRSRDSCLCSALRLELLLLLLLGRSSRIWGRRGDST